jgi:hypothetical protein
MIITSPNISQSRELSRKRIELINELILPQENIKHVFIEILAAILRPIK